MSGERHVSVSDVLLYGGVVLSTLSLTSSPHPPGQDPLHLFTLLSDLKPRGQKSNQLLRLLNESNFLPESTRRAHTSIATVNYPTLIQINKSHCRQGCATPQWQTMTVRLYHCMKTATYSVPQHSQSVISFKTGYNQNKSRGADWCWCHYTMNYTQYVMKISI